MTGVATLCYLANGPVPSEAANAVHVAHMCDALAGAGWRVTLVSPEPALARVFAGRRRRSKAVRERYGILGSFRSKSIWTPTVRGGGWLYRRWLALELGRTRPDLVYGRNIDGCLLAARRGYKTVLETHMPPAGRRGRFEEKFERLLLQPGFHRLVVVSQALSREFERRYPALAGRIMVAPDAAPERAGAGPGPRPRAGHGTFTVTYVGGLYEGKGIELLVRLAPLCPWARFVVVGGTNAEIARWREALPAGCDNMEFVGYRAHAQTLEYMVGADALVAPYQYSVRVHGNGGDDIARWMSPLKLFEYMSAARPIVASNLSVLREVLEDGRNALLADPDDAGQWQAALERLRSSPDLAASIAEQGYLDYRRLYTWPIRARNVLDALGLSKTAPGADLLLVLDTGLSGGGAARVASRLMAYWIQQGKCIDLVSLYGPEKDFYRQPEGVRRIVLGWDRFRSNPLSKLVRHAAYLFRLRRAIAESAAPVVLSLLTTANVRTIVAAAGLGKRVVISERSDLQHQRFGSRWGYLRRWVYRFAGVATANSPAAVQSLKRFVPPGKVTHLPNPVDFPEQCASPGRSRLILTVGRLIPLKAQTDILAAFARIAAEAPDWRIKIVGEGPEHDALQARARELGLEPRVTLTGSVGDPSQCYREAGIFVLPSWYEGTPNVLLEAMAHGLPCIVSSTVHGALEYMEDGVSGLMFRSRDIVDLAAKLKRLMDSPALRDHLGASARERMSAFTPEYVAAHWNAVLFRRQADAAN